MFNIADVVVIIIIGLTTFLGYKKGFIKTSLGFLSFFIALFLTFIMYKPVMGLIKDNTNFEEWLTNKLQTSMKGDIQDNDVEEYEYVSGESIYVNKEEKTYLEGLPDYIMELIGADEIKQNVKTTIVEKIVDFSLKLLSIVIVYITARVGLFILIIVLDLIAKLPVLKQFNEILGLIAGLILGFIRVYVICAILSLLGTFPATSGIASMVNSSIIASFLYNNNLLLKLLF